MFYNEWELQCMCVTELFDLSSKEIELNYIKCELKVIT